MSTTHQVQASLASEISAQLNLEYAGAVPPGRILAQAARAERRLRGVDLEPAVRRLLIQRTVRQRLVADSRRDLTDQEASPRRD